MLGHVFLYRLVQATIDLALVTDGSLQVQPSGLVQDSERSVVSRYASRETIEYQGSVTNRVVNFWVQGCFCRKWVGDFTVDRVHRTGGHFFRRSLHMDVRQFQDRTNRSNMWIVV